MKKLITLLVLVISIGAAKAEINNSEFKGHSVSLWNIKNQYAVRIFSLNHPNANQKEFQSISRSIEIPARFALNLNGIDKSFQFGGASDTDIKTGMFSRVEKKKIEALFEEYEGTNFNIGVGVLGGGISRSSNRDDVGFNDFNFSILLAPPGGAGINLGLSAYNYQLKITPVLKAALVTYNIQNIKNGKVVSTEEIKEVWDMSKVFSTELESE